MRRDIHDSSVEIPAGKSLWVALSVSGYRLQPVPEGYNHPMPRPNDTGTLLACFSLTTNMCGIWPKVGDLMTADEGLQKMRTFIAEKGRGNRA